MDFKRLGMFVRVLGLAVFGYGAFQFASNLDKEYKPPQFQSKDFFTAAREQADAAWTELKIQDENLARRRVRSNATKIMIGGGVVFFIGFALAASTKKPD
jgi:hypothetical protein